MKMNNPNSRAFDFVAHEEKIDSLIKRSFSKSYMSNSKWKKCFSLLSASASEFQVVWKFVGSENNGVRNRLPSEESLEENYISSRFWFGPMYFKEIEWLEFPAIGKPYGQENIPGAFYNQDIKSVKKALEAIGSWEIEETVDGFRIYGYKA